MSTLEINLVVKCGGCGDVLDVDIDSPTKHRSDSIVTVTPCEGCMDKAIEAYSKEG